MPWVIYSKKFNGLLKYEDLWPPIASTISPWSALSRRQQAGFYTRKLDRVENFDEKRYAKQRITDEEDEVIMDLYQAVLTTDLVTYQLKE